MEGQAVSVQTHTQATRAMTRRCTMPERTKASTWRVQASTIPSVNLPWTAACGSTSFVISVLISASKDVAPPPGMGMLGWMEGRREGGR